MHQYAKFPADDIDWSPFYVFIYASVLHWFNQMLQLLYKILYNHQSWLNPSHQGVPHVSVLTFKRFMLCNRQADQLSKWTRHLSQADKDLVNGISLDQ